MTMSPDLDEEVAAYESILVILEPTNTSAGSEDLTREIRFTSDNHTVKVGRASKTVSKGLVPDTTNAYFDSPVVSRTHAEISANFVDGSITVTDMGSLHGTSINEKPLEMNLPSILEQDDIVSFGIHVSRGLDVFYPTSCAVGLVRTPVKPTERSRSYCAPDSDDGLSDGADDYNSDSVCSVDVQVINGQRVTATYEIEDTDSSSDDDEAMSVKEIEICPAMEVLPSLGVSKADVDLSDETNEDEEDEDDGEDYGEIAEDDEDEEDDQDDEDDGEDEDEEEEGEEDEGNEEEEDNEGLTQQPDDINGYLMAELQGFSKNSASPLPGKEATPVGGEDSLAAHGLWTPPSITADDVAELSRIAEITAKFDISSLLNPSPPTSSPAKDQTDDNAIPTVYPSIFDAYETLDATVLPNNDMPMKIDTVINQQSTPPRFLPPIVSNPNSFTANNVASASMGLSGASASAAGAEADEGDNEDAEVAWEGIVDDEEENADDSPAMTSAATFVQYKKQRASNKKRKADEMLADIDAVTASTTAAPSAKRPATPAAIATKRVKSRGWAFAEKIGIAALGGAVVLGSLIYTAPSF
ncbi:hypothetical protein Sste5344_001081 [Sporothrix stenoceras]